MPINSQISYLGRDYASIKEDLKGYLIEKYPDMSANVEDENSIVSLLLDLNAVVADNLNFYLDRVFNESFITTAQEVDSIYRLSHMFGYSPKKKQPARGYVTLYIDIALSIWELGAKVSTVNLPRVDIFNSYFSLTNNDGDGIKYRFLYDIDFNDKTLSFFTEGEEVLNSKVNNYVTWSWEDNGATIRVYAKVPVEGSYFTTLTLGPFKGTAFETIHIHDDDYYRIFKVHTDWNNGVAHYTGNSFKDLWFEVDYMVNPYGFVRTDSIYGGKTRVQTRRRFITRNTATGTSLVFGYQNRDTLGFADVLDLPSAPDNVGASLGDPYWPLGKRPDEGTEMVCIYLQTAGSKTNLRKNMLKDSNLTLAYYLTPDDLDLHIPHVSESTAMAGGRNEETIEEIRHNIHSIFLNQNRAVTADDYANILMRMPQEWGVPVYKAGASARDVVIFKDPSSITMTASSFTHKEIDLYVLQLGSDGKFAQITDINQQQSLSNYIDHYRMLTDTVYFRRPNIIDINIDYVVALQGAAQASSVITEINKALEEFFHTSNWNFGQPIVYDDIVKLLSDIPGIRSITSFVVYENGDTDKVNLLSTRSDIEGVSVVAPNQIYQLNQISGDVR